MAAAGDSITQQLILLNQQESEHHIADESWRARYKTEHPTDVILFDCMDGREHFPTMTQTPTGLVHTFRALGARFEIFWKGLRTSVYNIQHRTKTKRDRPARNIALVPYHWSRTDEMRKDMPPSLGCAGWNYDLAAAKAHGLMFSKELEEAYGEQMTVIQIGVETDRDEITLIGPNGSISGHELIGADEHDISKEIHHRFPELDSQTLYDLTPFMLGNTKHVQTLLEHPRSMSDLEHNERIMAIGEGFDWLSVQNWALIINDIDPNLDEAIGKQALILEKNLARASPDEEGCLLISLPYRHLGIQRRQEAGAVRGLYKFAKRHIQNYCPNLIKSGRLRYLLGVLSEESRKLKIIEEGRVTL